MEKETFKKTVLAMILNSTTEAEKLIDRAIHSGAIDVQNEKEDDYTSRKALCNVIFKKFASDWMPLTENGKKEAKNLEHFI